MSLSKEEYIRILKWEKKETTFSLPSYTKPKSYTDIVKEQWKAGDEAMTNAYKSVRDTTITEGEWLSYIEKRKRRMQKEIAATYWVAGFWLWLSQKVASPLTALVSKTFWLDTPLKEWEKPWAVMRWIQAISDKWSEISSKFYWDVFSDYNITEAQRANAKYVWGEGATNLAFSLVGGGAIKGTWALWRVAKNTDIKVTLPSFSNKIDVDTEIRKVIQKYENVKVLFKPRGEVKDLENALVDLSIKAKEWRSSVADVNYIQKKFNLADLDVFKKIVEDANALPKIEQSTKILFPWYYKWKVPQKVDAVINKLNSLNFFKKEIQSKKLSNDVTFSKPQLQLLRENNISPKITKEAIEIQNNYNTTNALYHFNNINNINKIKINDFNDVKDDFQFHPKTDSVVFLEKEWYISILPDKKKNKFLYSATLTKKWEKYIQSLDLPESVKFKLQTEGVTHIPKELYDFVSGNSYKKAQELIRQLDWTSELKEIGRLYNERELGNITPTTDIDLINTLHKANERHSLWMKEQIDDIYNSITWEINNAKLLKAVQDIAHFRKTGFLNIKTKFKGDFKNLKEKLNYEAKINKVIYKEWENISKREYQAKIKDIRANQKRAIQALKRKSDIKWDKYIAEIYNITEKYRQQAINLAIKSKRIWEAKKLIKWQIVALYNNSSFTWDLWRVSINKFIKSSEIDEAVTPKQIQEAVSSLYTAITNSYISDIKKQIILELKKVKAPTKDLIKEKRLEYSMNELNDILTAKKLFDKSVLWEVGIEELETFLAKIKMQKEIGKSKAQHLKVERQERLNRIIWKIKKQWINRVEWLQNIINKDEASILKKISEWTKSFFNELNYKPRFIEKVFWKWLAYQYFVTRVDEWINVFNVLKDKIDNVSVLLSKHFNNDLQSLKEFGNYMKALQIQTKNGRYNYVWIKQLMQDDWSFFKKTRITYPKFTDVPDDFPLPQAQYDLVKNTKLWEILERYNDPDIKLAQKLWNTMFDELWSKIWYVSEMVDGVKLNKRDNYMPWKVIGGWDEWINMDFSDRKFIMAKVQDDFLNDIVDNVNNINYEYNPIAILQSSARQQAYYIAMRKIFDDLKQINNGVTYKLWKLSQEDIITKIQWGNFRVFNWKWEEILNPEWKPFSNVDELNPNSEGLIMSNKGLQEYDKLEIEAQWGISKDLTPEARKYMEEMMTTIARWGNIIDWQTEKLVSRIVAHANILPLVYNAWVVIKQSLTLMDALWHSDVGVKSLYTAMKDLSVNPEIMKELATLPVIKNRAGWNIFIREIEDAIYKNNLQKVYWQYLNWWTYIMRKVDTYTYSKIFYAAYKNFLLKQSPPQIMPDRAVFTFNNPRALAYATDVANRIAGTSNPLWLPPAYRSVFVKSFFWIFSTQLNRIQEMITQSRIAITNRDLHQLIQTQIMFLTANWMEVWITIWVKQLRDNILWIEKNEKDNKTFREQMFSINSLFRITLWQTFVWSKIEWTLDYGITWLSPTLWFADRVAKDIQSIYKNVGGSVVWDKDFDINKAKNDFLKTLTDMFWWYWAQKIFKSLNQE